VTRSLHPGAGREHLPWAWGVPAGAFVFESLSIAIAVLAQARSRPVVEFLRRPRDPTLGVVVLEDAAALVSIVLAAAGLALTAVTGDARWDGAASGAVSRSVLPAAPGRWPGRPRR
jgi:hypothetical protein